MKVFNDLNNLPGFKRAVVTIGSFDGVHTGHQKILEKVNLLAKRINGESVVITFHPHPRLVIYPKDNSLKLLSTIDEKVQLFEQYGVDNVVVVPFTIEFSQQSADEYIQKFLVEKFQPRYIVIGYDHRFGLNRQGNIDYLKWHGKSNGFEVVEIAKQEVEDIAVSSTKIRNSLENGNVAAAQKLLGHYFTLTGTVVRGQQIGSEIGFPTANLEIIQEHKLIPPNGIYAVQVIHQKNRYQGMLYIGDRPTLKTFHNRTIEVNIFEFNKDIYGDKLKLELIAFIREDQKFEDLEGLKVQLGKDKEAAITVLQSLEEGEEIEKKKQHFPEVAVVILNYNGREFLEKFLPSVKASAYPNFSIYIVDNGSTDDSLDWVKSAYPDIQLVDLKINHGFAKGYNLGLQQIEAPYYVLLNSDVEVTPGWIDPIIELMERDPSVGACQPKIKAFHQKELFEYAGASGGWLDNLGYPFCRGRIFNIIEKDEGQYDNTQEIFWATGAAFFIRSQLFHRIGAFDEDYFAHSEEIDLCWRIKRAGYKIMVRPRSVVYHVGGGTLNYMSPQKTYLNFRNSLFTLLKNEKAEKLLWLLPFRLILDGVAGGLFLVQGKWAHIRSIIRAHFYFYPRFFRTLRKRRDYVELINKVSINIEANDEGRYPNSIIWQFYALGKRYFRQL